MKKKEILELFKVKEIVGNKDNLLLTEKCRMTLEEVKLLPNIQGLAPEFEILHQEINERLKELNEAMISYNNLIKKCQHEVRLHQRSSWRSSYECIFCKKTIAKEGCENWEESINLNKYCVNLENKYYVDEDGYEEIYREDAYTYEDIMKIILTILEDKGMDEEIDLVQEFKKLNLKYSEINEKKKQTEHYILILGGSNKYYIGKDFYLKKDNILNSLDFVRYFKDMMNIKVAVIDNREVISGVDGKKIQDEGNKYLMFLEYEQIKDLEWELERIKSVSFDLIINLMRLDTYKAIGNEIIREKYEIDLEKIFPGSQIINVKDGTQIDFKEITQRLMEAKDKKKQYVYSKPYYYYLENGEVTTGKLNQVGNQMKRVLRNGTRIRR